MIATDYLVAALDLAAHGWAVVPCRERCGPDAKSPYTVHGHHDASSDPEMIRAWWTRWPAAMIGAPVPDTLLVLDIDPRNGGSLEALTEALGPLPATLTTWSGRGDGGRHLYYRRPAGQFTSARLPAGVDLKVNGYCIVPPSIHPATGEPYRWEDRPVAWLPDRASTLLLPPPRKPWTGPRHGDGHHLVEVLHRHPQHGINDALYWAACKAAQDGILDQLANDLVSTAVQLGSPERAARRTVDSANDRFGVA